MAVHAFADRAVVQGQDLDPGALAALQPQRGNGAVSLGDEAGDLHGPAPGDVQHGAYGVGAVKGRIQVVSPVVFLAVGDARPDGRAIVDVFALGVHHIPDVSPGISLAHLKRVPHVTVVLGIGVHSSAVFHGLYEFYGLGHGLTGEHLAQYMPSAAKQPDGKGGMFVGIVCKDDGVHVVPEKILEALVQCEAEPGFLRGISGFFQRGNIFVAYGDEFGFRMPEQYGDHGHAAVRAEDADPDFSVHGVSSFLVL